MGKEEIKDAFVNVHSDVKPVQPLFKQVDEQYKSAFEKLSSYLVRGLSSFHTTCEQQTKPTINSTEQPDILPLFRETFHSKKAYTVNVSISLTTGKMASYTMPLKDMKLGCWQSTLRVEGKNKGAQKLAVIYNLNKIHFFGKVAIPLDGCHGMPVSPYLERAHLKCRGFGDKFFTQL